MIEREANLITEGGWRRRIQSGGARTGRAAQWAASNAEHDEFNDSNAGEQHCKSDKIIFEPMPTIGKHHVHPYSHTVLFHKRYGFRELLAEMYSTPVSGVLRRKDFGFAVCGKNLASVSHFVAGIGPPVLSSTNVPSSFESKENRSLAAKTLTAD